MTALARHYRSLALLAAVLAVAIGVAHQLLPGRFSLSWSLWALAAYTVWSLVSCKWAAVSAVSRQRNAFLQAFMTLVFARLFLTLLVIWLSYRFLPRKDGFLFVYLGIYLVMSVQEAMAWSGLARSAPP